MSYLWHIICAVPAPKAGVLSIEWLVTVRYVYNIHLLCSKLKVRFVPRLFKSFPPHNTAFFSGYNTCASNHVFLEFAHIPTVVLDEVNPIVQEQQTKSKLGALLQRHGQNTRVRFTHGFDVCVDGRADDHRSRPSPVITPRYNTSVITVLS